MYDKDLFRSSLICRRTSLLIFWCFSYIFSIYFRCQIIRVESEDRHLGRIYHTQWQRRLPERNDMRKKELFECVRARLSLHDKRTKEDIYWGIVLPRCVDFVWRGNHAKTYNMSKQNHTYSHTQAQNGGKGEQRDETREREEGWGAVWRGEERTQHDLSWKHTCLTSIIRFSPGAILGFWV